MKKLVSLIVIATFTFSAQAQVRDNEQQDLKQNGNRKFHGKPGHMMAEKLGFTDDQKKQMKSIDADLKNRMGELKNSNLSAEELRIKKEELMKERKQKMMALLTPEQKDKMKGLRGEEHNKKISGAERMEKMKEKLSLSNEQVEKINAHNKDFTSKVEAIKNNQALSIEEKKAQMKAIREERTNSFRSVLTPAQLKKMEDMKQKRSRKTT